MSVRRQAALAAVVAVLLSGCSEEPEPRFEEPTSTPTRSASGPKSPTTTTDSPMDTVSNWVRRYNEFEESGDPSDLRALANDCASCEEVIGVVTKAYASGGFVESKGWAIQGTPEQLYLRPRSAGIRASVKVSPSKYKASASSKVSQGTGGLVTMEFDLRRVQGKWLVWQMTRRPT